jgi:hypothetical protein
MISFLFGACADRQSLAQRLIQEHLAARLDKFWQQNG